MSKKKYIVIGITALIFIIAIIIVLVMGKTGSSWKNEILSSNNYEIIMKDCNDTQTTFPKETVKEVLNKLNNISDNGPFTGDNNACYNTVTISYEKNSIINSVEIKIIDKSSITININNTVRYYTNATDVVSYLNEQFSI